MTDNQDNRGAEDDHAEAVPAQIPSLAGSTANIDGHAGSPSLQYNSAMALSERGFRLAMRHHDDCNETIRLLREENERRARECYELSTRLRSLEDERCHDDDNDTIRVLREDSQRRARECHQLSSKVRHLQNQLDAKENELHERQVESLRLNEQTEVLRGMILADAGNQKISDAEIVQAFVNVRQGALSIAKSKAIRVDQTPALELDTPPHVNNFYLNSGWSSWKTKDRELHVREKVFEILYHFVLDTASFGIRGSCAAAPETLGLIAQGLTDLGSTAKEKQVSPKMLANRRAATFECVEALDVLEQRTEHVVQELWYFIAPILDKTSPILVETLQSRALGLSKDAMNLTITMRKSPDEYRCKAKPDMMHRDRADLESWADAHAVDEGKNSEAGENVAYVLFGALTKKSTRDEGVERVLVKAEVVMEKRTS